MHTVTSDYHRIQQNGEPNSTASLVVTSYCLQTTGSQWRRQDTEVAWAQELQAVEGSALRCVVLIIPREARKKKIAFIFQLPGWALMAPTCFALQAILA